MTELIAKPVVKNKFWVVEDRGNKIATIQARDDGGFVYVHDDLREYFSTTKDMKQKLNIRFGSAVKQKKDTCSEVYGYPIKGKSYNQVYDITRKIPIFSKTPKSKSLYCAGYYYINSNGVWTLTFCPKNITLNRYKFYGPYKSQTEAEENFLRINNASN
jgi:hypothetical protein